MHSRNFTTHHGKRRGVGRMGVDDGPGLGAVPEDVAVEAPLAGGFEWAFPSALPVDENDLLRPDPV